MSTTSPPNSPPTLGRSISYHPASPASNSNKPLPPPLFIDADAHASAHASSSSSSYQGSSLATRTRSRSVGSKSKDAGALHPSSSLDGNGGGPLSPSAIGHQLDRGSGTPDFVLGAPPRTSSGAAYDKGKGRVTELIRDGGGSGGGADGAHGPSMAGGSSSSSSASASASASASSASASSASAATRPRLTSRLRSFFTSFPGVDGGSAGAGPSSVPMTKARTSGDYSYVPQHAQHAQHVRSSPSRPSSAPRPRGLVMPSARPAGSEPFGVLGLNDESPPLTPTSDGPHDREQDASSYLHPMSLGTAADSRWAGAGGSARRALNVSSGSSTDESSNTSSSAFNLSTPPLTTSSSSPTSRSDSPVFLGGVGAGASDCRPAMSLGTGGALAQSLLPTSSSSRQLYATHSGGLKSLSIPSLSLSDLNAKLQAGLRSRSLRQHMPTMLMLLTFFVASTLVVFLLLTTLPLRMPAHALTQLSLAEIRDICLSLRDYATSTPQAYHHTLFVLCLFFTYKQAFNVPGSIISNVVFGALFGPWKATFWLSIFTAIGGIGAAVMSALIAPLVLKMPGMQKAVNMMRRALGNKNLGKAGGPGGHGHGHRSNSHAMRRNRNSPAASRSTTPRPRTTSPHPSGKSRASKAASSGAAAASAGGGNLFSILLLLRLLPLTPYGMMNIACGILNVPILPFGATLALGSVPWNAVTAQLGEILVEVVAAFPVEEAASQGGAPTLGDQLDAGGFHNVAPPGADGLPAFPAEKIHDVLASEKSRITSAAHKAGGGVKILLAKIWTKEMMFKLVGLSLLSVTPVLLGRWWKARQTAIQAKARKERHAAHAAAQAQRDAAAAAAVHSETVSSAHHYDGMDGSAAYQTSSSGHLQAPFTAHARPAAAVLDWSDGEDSDDGGSTDRSTDDDEYEYADEDAEEDDTLYTDDEDTRSKASSSGFAAMAESGPALIASITRSASRNSWNSAWFRSPSRNHHVSTPSPASAGAGAGAGGDAAAGATDAAWAAFGGHAPPGSAPAATTPQLELARNPFESVHAHTHTHTHTHSRSPSQARRAQRDIEEGAASAYAHAYPHATSAPPHALDFNAHPALAALTAGQRKSPTPAPTSAHAHSRSASLAPGGVLLPFSGDGAPAPAHAPAHARQSSLSALDAAGLVNARRKREPKRFTAVLGGGSGAA